MRLTLRTLLAYLDGILEPNDSQDLGKKVEESEFATSLVDRVRDVMRRLRLGAPSLADRGGPGLDPNTVAEYLDNTLATDRVTDFEKVCLDSDVHLAEVASCHQILTLVLGEPAEVDPAGRQRIYQFKDVHNGSKPPPVPLVEAGGAAPLVGAPLALNLEEDDDESTARKSRLKPTVPEYLREPRRRPAWLPIAAAVVLAVCFTVVVLKAMGLLEPGTFLGDLMAPRDVAMVHGERGEGREERVEGREERVEGREERVEGREERGEGTEQSEAPPVDKPAAEAAEKQPAAEPGKGAVKKPAAEKPAVAESVKTPLTKPAKKPTKPPVAEPAKEPVRSAEGLRPQTPAEAAPEPTPKPAAEPKTKFVVEPTPLPPEPLGRLTSNDQVLLNDDPADGGWMRVGPNQMLVPRHVLALPTYRAKVALTMAGVGLEILGGTRVELTGGSPQELPGIRLLYGRVVLTPLAKAGVQLPVAFGDRTGTITFADAESVAALEVHCVHALGMNPESEPSHVTANLYVTTGDVLWEETVGGKGGQQPLRLAPPQRLNFDAQLTSSAPIAAKELPRWIVAEPIGALDHRASAAIAQALPTDQLARLGLLELATSRPQKEVKWLSLRCLGYIGQFRDMVAVLDDPAHKLDWPDYVDELRTAVARDPQTAVAIRLALEKQYPQQAADLYRMLWGYTDKGLQAGDDEKLVKALDDDALAVRVLSIWNLKDITGLGQYYQPEQTAARRQQPTRRWRQRLEAKEIRLKTSNTEASAGENVAPPASK